MRRATEPSAADTPAVETKADARRRRIRNWLIFFALVALAGFVYAIAILRMYQQHTIPRFV